MPKSTDVRVAQPGQVDLARKCLELIRDIADRGACSSNPGDVAFALQELSQVLLERTGREDRVFAPEEMGSLEELRKLHDELAFVDDATRDVMRVN